MRRILVTGANKGIGRAIVEAVLAHEDDTFVYLGSRDLARGRAAAKAITGAHPSWAKRLEVLELDVSRDDSVTAAAAKVRKELGDDYLYGVVNNAGVGPATADLRTVLEVNTFGVRRVCDAFLPLLEPSGGRIVNITSASGPKFVSECSSERRRFLTDPDTDWTQLEELIDECLAIDAQDGSFEAAGLGDGDAYGLSKACSNTYTQHLARRHPQLRINACTPGFIETDLTRPYAEGKAPAVLGMMPPAEGTHSPLFLLFGEPEGNGRYYGSDKLRSPLDRYRSPGTAAYQGR